MANGSILKCAEIENSKFTKLITKNTRTHKFLDSFISHLYPCNLMQVVLYLGKCNKLQEPEEL